MATFTVNGTVVTAEGNRKLLAFLRDDLRLTSVKDGCSEGACGTCTVLIDGKAQKACIFTLDKLEGKSVTTVEGLSDFEKDVYVEAFGQAGAVQCGFCIPGMVICAKALLDKTLEPTDTEIANALRGNLCRCTGYVKIMEAVRLAARMLREKRIIEGENSWTMGARVYRIDLREK
ncbi:MAG: 2Fe-2S iron-sulfur cluster binding domain-containing protein, partial [Oscillospiraceae bacterium]|nr:2Fe-2S iron-sulfur cluster binding domain-containing protein [Oscillospiraceae bacterium]